MIMSHEPLPLPDASAFGTRRILR